MISPKNSLIPLLTAFLAATTLSACSGGGGNEQDEVDAGAEADADADVDRGELAPLVLGRDAFGAGFFADASAAELPDAEPIRASGTAPRD